MAGITPKQNSIDFETLSATHKGSPRAFSVNKLDMNRVQYTFRLTVPTVPRNSAFDGGLLSLAAVAGCRI